MVVFDKFLQPLGLPEDKVTLIAGDLVKKEQIVEALQKHKVELVFHVASPDPNCPNRQLLWDVNVTGTRNVLEACKEAGVQPCIYTSSASVVWQGQGQTGVDESISIPSVFRDPYAETKARAEELAIAAGKGRAASAAGLLTISIRPHAIFGPNDRQMVPTVAELCKAGRQGTVVGTGENVVDWTYVGNVVHAHMLAAQTAWRAVKAKAPCSASGRTFFITNDSPMPFWQFMNWVIIGLGYSPSKLRLPLGFLLAIAHVAQFFAGLVSKLKGGKPVELKLSPSRLLISGTDHWYNVSAAKKELQYRPLWDMQQAIYLTLKSFPQFRNAKPSAADLQRAAEGNLFAVGLLVDPEAERKRLEASRQRSKELHAAALACTHDKDLPQLTAAEVAQHNNLKDLWVIIDGIVYDLTDYVKSHPGGLEIGKHAGGDASIGFKGEQHPASVYDTVKRFKIGTLAKGK